MAASTIDLVPQARAKMAEERNQWTRGLHCECDENSSPRTNTSLQDACKISLCDLEEARSSLGLWKVGVPSKA